MSKPLTHHSGFTLIELSMVLIIISLLMGNLLPLVTNEKSLNSNLITQEKLKYIDQAITNYFAEYGAIPCPADATLANSDSNFGISAKDYSNSTCLGTTSRWYSNTRFRHMELGAIPTKTLNINDDYAFDEWGRRITYLIINPCSNSQILTLAGYGGIGTNIEYNNDKNFSDNINCGVDYLPTKTAFNIQNTTNHTNINSKAIIILLSHGKNGHGAYPKAGGTNRIVAITTVGVDEVINSQFTNDGNNQLNDGIFIKRSLNHSIGDDHYDDLLHYITKDQLISKAKGFNQNSNYNQLCNISRSILDSESSICGIGSNINCQNYLTILASQINSLCW